MPLPLAGRTAPVGVDVAGLLAVVALRPGWRRRPRRAGVGHGRRRASALAAEAAVAAVVLAGDWPRVGVRCHGRRRTGRRRPRSGHAGPATPAEGRC